MKQGDKKTSFSIGFYNYIKSFREHPKAGSHQFLLQREALLGSFQYLRSKAVIKEYSEKDTLFCSIPSCLPEHIRRTMKRMFIRSEFLQAAHSGGKNIFDFNSIFDGVREEAPLYSSSVIYRLLDYNPSEMNFLGRLGEGESRGCERLIKYNELLAKDIQILKILVEEFNIEVTALIPYCKTIDEADFVKRAIRAAIPNIRIGLMVETFTCLESLFDYMPVCTAFLGSSDLLADYECIDRSNIDYTQFHELTGMNKRVIKALENQLPKIYKLGHMMEICTCKDLNSLRMDSTYNVSRTYTPDQLVLSDDEYMQKFGTKAIG